MSVYFKLLASNQKQREQTILYYKQLYKNLVALYLKKTMKTIASQLSLKIGFYIYNRRYDYSYPSRCFINFHSAHLLIFKSGHFLRNKIYIFAV